MKKKWFFFILSPLSSLYLSLSIHPSICGKKFRKFDSAPKFESLSWRAIRWIGIFVFFLFSMAPAEDDDASANTDDDARSRFYFHLVSLNWDKNVNCIELQSSSSMQCILHTSFIVGQMFVHPAPSVDTKNINIKYCIQHRSESTRRRISMQTARERDREGGEDRNEDNRMAAQKCTKTRKGL